MGSLSPSLPPTSAPEYASNNYQIYACFCLRRSVSLVSMSNWLESYNPTNNSWRPAGCIPGIPENHVLKGFAMVSLANFIYIIGGRLCRREPDGDEGMTEVDVAVRPDVLRYDTAASEWSTCAPLAVPRCNFACTAIGGKIFAAGGQCAVSTARGTASAEVYNPTQDQWAPLPAMRRLRYKCVGVAWRGRFYVIGGFAEREEDVAVMPFIVERSSAEAYDEGSGEWELMPGMWQLDVPPNQIVAIGARLFSSGDCLKEWKGHIEEYDGKLGIWNIVEQSQPRRIPAVMETADGSRGEAVAPVAERLYLTMAPIETRLYFLAGYRMVEGCVSMVHVFDTSPESREGWRGWEVEVEAEEEAEEGCKELCSHCCVVDV